MNRGAYWFCLGVLWVSLWSVLVAPAFALQPPLWEGLPSGKYAVGFRSYWVQDYSRTYNMTFADKSPFAKGKSPRPLLLNIWYPAARPGTGKPMPHRGYLQITPTQPQLRKLAAALTQYEQETISQEVMGKPLNTLTNAERQQMEQYLNTPTACQRNAPPANGRFPTVLYHSGYGSSFEDNSVLCEFLASYGYVVIGSAFQEPSGKSFNIDGKSTSARDMAFLIAQAQTMPNVDWQHIGVIGHSGGAHASLTFRAQESSAIDALVSLDTTQDYYSLADTRWTMVPIVLKGRENFTGPLLVAANPHAFFPLFETLDQSHRYYLTLRDLEHNDFISQGIAYQTLVVQRLPATAPGENAEKRAEEKRERERLVALRQSYTALCRYILGFLNAYLKSDQTARERLKSEYTTTKLGGSEPHVEIALPGVAGPPPYQDGEARLPTPRQLRPYLRKEGVEKTVALLRRVHEETPTHPVLHNVFFLALIYELLNEGKTQDAIAITAFADEIHPNFKRIFGTMGDFYVRTKRLELATDYYKKALLLDPANTEIARKLRELKAD